MPSAGNTYQVELQAAHINWGTRGASRKTTPRSSDEAYVQIPLTHARSFDILSGVVFNGKSSDGYFSAEVKASGSAGKDLRFAKQFQGNGNLKLFGSWFNHINAQEGDIIKVEFTSSTDVVFTKL